MYTIPPNRALSTCQTQAPIQKRLFTSSPPLQSLTVLLFNLRQSLNHVFVSMAAPSSDTGDSSKKGVSQNDPVESERRSRILSSKLYFDVPSSKVPLVYSSSYNIAFLGIEKLHPFDSLKWGRICQFLIAEGLLDKKHMVEPLEATKSDLLVVHSESYLNSLKSSLNVSTIIEVPPVALLPNCLVDKHVLYPFRKQVGGTILSAKLAKERGWAINVCGGFHHCSAAKGGRSYILDMYNPDIHPFDYEARRYINQMVEVASGTSTNEYLSKLDEALKVAAGVFDPELIIYNAGTDILDGDPLGRLKVSLNGIAARDEKVFRFARERNIPLVMLTSGGYMKSSAKVIADSIINLSKQSLIDMESTKNVTIT